MGSGEPIQVPELIESKSKKNNSITPASFTQVFKPDEFKRKSGMENVACLSNPMVQSVPNETNFTEAALSNIKEYPSKTSKMESCLTSPLSHVDEFDFSDLAAPSQLTPESMENMEASQSIIVPVALSEKKPKFYISSSHSTSDPDELMMTRFNKTTDSLDMQRNYQTFAPAVQLTDEETLSDDSELDDLDSLYSDETESCYGESWSYKQSPIFSKVTLAKQRNIQIQSSSSKTPNKSLLSAALDQPSRNTCANGPIDTPLSDSVRQTLIWDRCMPFNTRIQCTKPKNIATVANSTSWNDQTDDLW